MSDNVTRPAHYTSGDIECIDAIRASMSAEEFQGYAKGAILKYVWRWRQKGGVEDLRKAGVYLGWLIESAEGREAKPKPDTVYPWHLAPEKANYAAMDADGVSHWYFIQPYCVGGSIWSVGSLEFKRRIEGNNHFPGDWKESVEARPVTQEAEAVTEKKSSIYPWHLAPDSAVGATTDADGWVFWWSEKPRIYAQMWVGGLSFQRAKGCLPLGGDWRDSWRWRPGKEPRP